MLMQNFKSAIDLGITDAQKDALAKTLVLLETGKLKHEVPSSRASSYLPGLPFTGHFNMTAWGSPDPMCGTIACIGGTAEMVGNVLFGAWWESENDNLRNLFAPQRLARHKWYDITSEQAATALRSYLTTGEARWDLAVR